MPCCLGCLALAFPRGALAFMWLIGYTAHAFETVMWPILGFLFMPFTTCAYAIAMNEVGSIRGAGLALLIIGVFFDLGSHGGTASSGSHYRRTHRIVRR